MSKFHSIITIKLAIDQEAKKALTMKIWNSESCSLGNNF